jgi:hypothetical protein
MRLTNTRKIALAAAVAIVASLAPSAIASAGGTADVTVVHGIGPAPQPVDVYVGGTDATEWDLAIADLQFGESVDAGALPAGGYNVLICAPASGAPLETITACIDNEAQAVNGNSGTNVDLAAGVPEMWVAAYGDPEFGRPGVLEVEPDLSCVEADADARATAVHAATAPEVNVLVDGDEVVSDLAYSESAALDVPAGAYDIAVELTTGDPVLDLTDVDLAAETNTVVFVVGNPQFDAPFEVVTTTFPLEPCDVPTTTTTPPTTATGAGTATPRFTG